MARTPGRPASYNRTFSRDDLLDLATRAFAEKGFSDVSIRRLAAEAGVSDSLFIHHFGSKLKLWREAVDRMIELEFPQLIARLSRHDHSASPLVLLQDNFAEILRLAQQRPAIFRLLFNELDSGGERADYLKEKYLIPYVTIFDHTIAQCQAQGLIKPLSHSSLHALLLGAVNILIRPWILRQGKPADARQAAISIPVEDLLEIMFNGAINTVATTAAQNCER